MAATTATTTNRSLTIRQVEGRPGQVYYPLQLNTGSLPQPGPDEVLVRLHAAALNHRDLFLRQHLYPGLSFASPLLADGLMHATFGAGALEDDGRRGRENRLRLGELT